MFLANKVEQLILGFELLADPIIDIGSVETADKGARIAQLQALDNFGPSALIGGGGQGDARNGREAFMQQWGRLRQLVA